MSRVTSKAPPPVAPPAVPDVMASSGEVVVVVDGVQEVGLEELSEGDAVVRAAPMSPTTKTVAVVSAVVAATVVEGPLPKVVLTTASEVAATDVLELELSGVATAWLVTERPPEMSIAPLETDVMSGTSWTFWTTVATNWVDTLCVLVNTAEAVTEGEVAITASTLTLPANKFTVTFSLVMALLLGNPLLTSATTPSLMASLNLVLMVSFLSNWV